MSSYYHIFQSALSRTLNDYLGFSFSFENERDLQSLLFHYALRSIYDHNLQIPAQIHAQPRRYGAEPDLVLGNDEIFVEIKFSKPNTGSYTEALRKWIQDVGKLNKYKQNKRSSRCLFLAIDESGYHSNPSSSNFFDPNTHQLTGRWAKLANNAFMLLGEV